MKYVNKEKRSAEIAKKIMLGSTWDELERQYVLTRAYMQACLRQYCKETRQYNLLLAKARANAKVNAVYIAETGALLNNYGFLKGKNRVFVPEFCKKEIQKIEPKNSNVLENPKICWCDISWGRVKHLPSRELKHRTISIAAFSCEMARRHPTSRIVVYTNSRDVVELIEAQQMRNISIVKF